MSQCAECGKIHPEDRLIEEAGFTWDQLEEFSQKKDWPLASKLATLLIEIGNECEHQWHRADLFARSLNEGQQG